MSVQGARKIESSLPSYVRVLLLFPLLTNDTTTQATIATSLSSPTLQIVLEWLFELFLGIIGACLKAPIEASKIMWVSQGAQIPKIALPYPVAYVQISRCQLLSCTECGFSTIDDMDMRIEFAHFVTKGSVFKQKRTNRELASAVGEFAQTVSH